MSGKGKIVVIDDSELVLSMVEAELAGAGYQVITRRTPFGSGALIMREQPDLVLLDVTMPALSGDDLLSLVRKHDAAADHTVVLLYSDRSFRELEEIASRCGADGFIKKSGDLEGLVIEVERWLNSGKRGRSAPASAALGAGSSGSAAGSGTGSANSAGSTAGMKNQPRELASLLFVDSDSEALRGYRRAFSDYSYTAYASTGADALSVLRSDSPPNVVVASLALSDMSAVDLYQQAIASNPMLRKRFIVLVPQAYGTRAVERIDGPVLPKPVDVDGLRNVIQGLG